MKWTVKPDPFVATLRIRRRFLWWPLQIGTECRWMESGIVQERCVSERKLIAGKTGPYWHRSIRWVPERFVVAGEDLLLARMRMTAESLRCIADGLWLVDGAAGVADDIHWLADKIYNPDDHE